MLRCGRPDGRRLLKKNLPLRLARSSQAPLPICRHQWRPPLLPPPRGPRPPSRLKAPPLESRLPSAPALIASAGHPPHHLLLRLEMARVSRLCHTLHLPRGSLRPSAPSGRSSQRPSPWCFSLRRLPALICPSKRLSSSSTRLTWWSPPTRVSRLTCCKRIF